MRILQRAIGNASPLDLARLVNRFDFVFLEHERPELAYSLIRDVIVLTDRRYIEIDAQGVRGKKIEYFSVPYNRISAFSVETAGALDLDGELKIWASGVRGITRAARSQGCSVYRRFAKGVDVYLVQRLLAYHVCGEPRSDLSDGHGVGAPGGSSSSSASGAGLPDPGASGSPDRSA